MRQLLTSFVCLCSITVMAQTKEIAFKSHSGNMDKFHISLTNALFGSEESDFGLPAPTAVKSYKLDSVIYVSDTVSIVVVKEYQRMDDQRKGEEKLIRVGKDTLYKDPLLANRHSLDSIRAVMHSLGYYVNPIESVVFVGFDNKAAKDKKSKDKHKQNAIPVFSIPGDSSGNSNSPFGPTLYLMIGAVVLLSLAGGWLSWKYYQPRFR